MICSWFNDFGVDGGSAAKAYIKVQRTLKAFHNTYIILLQEYTSRSGYVNPLIKMVSLEFGIVGGTHVLHWVESSVQEDLRPQRRLQKQRPPKSCVVTLHSVVGAS